MARHIHDEALAEASGGSQAAVRADHCGREFIDVEAALHQRHSLAGALEVDGPGGGGEAVRGVHAAKRVEVRTESVCFSQRYHLGSDTLIVRPISHRSPPVAGQRRSVRSRGICEAWHLHPPLRVRAVRNRALDADTVAKSGSQLTSIGRPKVLRSVAGFTELIGAYRSTRCRVDTRPPFSLRRDTCRRASEALISFRAWCV